MARETKAQREARLFQEQAVEEARQAREYPTRLMAALEEATTKNNYELTVRNGMFVLHDRNTNNNTLDLTLQFNAHSQNELESLEWDLEQYAQERAESERLSALRRQAFLKLSKEEQQALGLNDRNNW